MNLLLDTHVLLWAAGVSGRLPAPTRALIENLDNETFFSAASIWEVAIKSAQGRPGFNIDPFFLRRHLLEQGYAELAVAGDHAATTVLLPAIHKDPFDRILIAQAQTEGLTLLTADQTVARYPGQIQNIRSANR